jgi:hypothetical protein
MLVRKLCRPAVSHICGAAERNTTRSRHTGIIEFAGLADTQAARANDEHLLDINEVACSLYGAAIEVRLGIWSFLGDIVPRGET